MIVFKLGTTPNLHLTQNIPLSTLWARLFILCIYVPKLCPGYLLKDFSEIMDHHTLEAASNQQQAGPQVSSAQPMTPHPAQGFLCKQDTFMKSSELAQLPPRWAAGDQTTSAAILSLPGSQGWLRMERKQDQTLSLLAPHMFQALFYAIFYITN